MEGLSVSLHNACANYNAEEIRRSSAAIAALLQLNTVEEVCHHTSVCSQYEEYTPYLIRLAHGTVGDWRTLVRRVAARSDLPVRFVSYLFSEAKEFKNAEDVKVYVLRRLEGVKWAKKVAIDAQDCWIEEEDNKYRL